MAHVIVFVHLVTARVNVLCHVVQMHALEDQVMTVMVLCVIPVVVIVVEETVVLVVHVAVNALLTDVIPHVIIGVIMCV